MTAEHRSSGITSGRSDRPRASAPTTDTRASAGSLWTMTDPYRDVKGREGRRSSSVDNKSKHD